MESAALLSSGFLALNSVLFPIIMLGELKKQQYIVSGSIELLQPSSPSKNGWGSSEHLLALLFKVFFYFTRWLPITMDLYRAALRGNYRGLRISLMVKEFQSPRSHDRSQGHCISE